MERAMRLGMSVLVAMMFVGSAAPVQVASASMRGGRMTPPASNETSAGPSVDASEGPSLEPTEAPSLATTVAPVLHLTPRTIDTRSHGRWVTAHLDFGTGTDASLVDTTTLIVTIAGVPTTLTPAGTAVSDESTSVLVVRYSRADLASLLSSGPNVVVITGAWLDGTVFTATDTIRAKTPGGGSHGKGHHAHGGGHGRGGSGRGHGHGGR
jgi:hypothetical protein